MNPAHVVDEAKKKFQAAFEHFEGELKKVRTGRAHASMLDGIVVSAYGTAMPLNQVANVTAPEAQLLQITPFDPSNIQAIASAGFMTIQISLASTQATMAAWCVCQFPLLMKSAAASS